MSARGKAIKSGLRALGVDVGEAVATPRPRRVTPRTTAVAVPAPKAVKPKARSLAVDVPVKVKAKPKPPRVDPLPAEGLRGAESPYMISTRRPSEPNYAVYGNPDAEMIVQTGDALAAHRPAFEKNMALLSEEPFMHGTSGLGPDAIRREATRRGADNLKFITNELMTPEGVDASRNWYPVAQGFSERAAARNNMPVQAGYGVAAVLSPQTPWDINVAKMDRMMDMHPGGFSVDPKDAEAWMRERLARGPKGAGAVAGLGEDFVRRIAETPYNELTDPFDRYARVVMADATRNSPELPRVLLSGEYGEPYGSAMTWGNSSDVNKALNILDDPTMDTINRQMLGGGKVPTFYNNITAPFSAHPLSTIDTHSAGAVGLFPAGANDPIAYRGMGLGRGNMSLPPAASGSDRSGAKGLYGPFSDMHTLAGQEMDMLPREVQSVTWEGVRNLWGQSKKTADLKAAITDIHRTSATPDEARYRIADMLGRPVPRSYAVTLP